LIKFEMFASAAGVQWKLRREESAREYNRQKVKAVVFLPRPILIVPGHDAILHPTKTGDK
jgi:hypothetical protein